MDVLSKCADLQTLAILFHFELETILSHRIIGAGPRKEGSEDPTLDFQHPELKLPAFSGLQRLSLHGIWGNVNSWRTQLVQVFLNSPRLKHISLSVSLKSLKLLELDRRASVSDKEFPNFFERFATHCDEDEVQPLNLKSLRLGWKLVFPKMSGMAKSILNTLEEVFIDNDESQATFNNLSDVFGSSFPPKLRILSFRDRGAKTWEFLPSLLHSARTSALGDEFGIISARDDGHCPDLRIHKLCGVPKDNLPMIMFALDKNLDGHETSVAQLPGPSFVTSLAIKAPEYLGDSDELPVILPGFCNSVTNFPALKALWIMNPFLLGRGNQASETWQQAWTLQGCAVAAEQISQASRSLRYIRIGIQAWRIWRKDADESKVSLEVLDEWEDEVEGPDFFHVPFPQPWNIEMHHVDWRYQGY
jgi:hypothetical protein